jgi:hypothetical protein
VSPWVRMTQREVADANDTSRSEVQRYQSELNDGVEPERWGEAAEKAARAKHMLKYGRWVGRPLTAAEIPAVKKRDVDGLIAEIERLLPFEEECVQLKSRRGPDPKEAMT